jgi:tRNA(fMet)-specific endonuclease VapC
MYLLDTNIVVFYFRGNKTVIDKIDSLSLNNCSISEITIAELKYGALKSGNFEKHNKLIEDFKKYVRVISILEVIDTFASEKVRLEKLGEKLDNFDLLIGATAIANELILVTNNTKHLQRMSLKNIEDWTI